MSVKLFGCWDENDRRGSFNVNNYIDRFTNGRNPIAGTRSLAVKEYGDAFLIQTDSGYRAFDCRGLPIEDTLVARHGIGSPKMLRLPKSFWRSRGSKRKMESIHGGRISASSLRPDLEFDALLYLGVVHRQFGHQITEGLRHFWVALHDPSLFQMNWVAIGSEKYKKFEQLIRLMGIPTDRRLDLRGGHIVRVRRLLVPEPGMCLFGDYAPEMGDLWSLIATTARQVAAREYLPEKIFLDRRSDKRKCADLDEIKRLMIGRGYRIITSEAYPLVDEIALISAAQAVAGFAGSDMHMVQFNAAATISLFSHHRFVASDYLSTARINGNTVNLFLCDGNAIEPDQHLTEGYRFFDRGNTTESLEQAVDEAGL